jgi:hypothetical protein
MKLKSSWSDPGLFPIAGCASSIAVRLRLRLNLFSLFSPDVSCFIFQIYTNCFSSPPKTRFWRVTAEMLREESFSSFVPGVVRPRGRHVFVCLFFFFFFFFAFLLLLASFCPASLWYEKFRSYADKQWTPKKETDAAIYLTICLYTVSDCNLNCTGQQQLYHYVANNNKIKLVW